MTFEVGDKVIYPNQGLGVVTRIEEKTILGTTCGFYHLRIVANETTVLVPLDNVDGVGLRRAIGDAEVERLFSALGNGKIDNHQNWKGRFKDNSDKMRTGSIYDVADVLKSLTLLSRSKSLSFREKRMLDRAKFLIISEISEVMRESIDSVEDRVDKALERSFTARSRAVARAKTAKAAPPRRGRRATHRTRILTRVQAHRKPLLSATHGAATSTRRPFFVYAPCHMSAPGTSSPAVAIAAVRSAAAYVAVSLYVAVTAPPGMLLALLFRWKGVLYMLGHGGVALGAACAGIRTRVAGLEHVPRGRAVVFCANHQSNIDPPILFQALHPRLHVLFKAEMTKLPLLGRAFQIGGFVPIDRRHREQSMAAIEQAADSLSARQLVPHVSRRDPQPDRRAAALQAGPVPDCHQGTGAGHPRRGAGRDGVDAERQRHRPAGHRQRENRRAGRDRRPDDRRSRETGRCSTGAGGGAAGDGPGH